jgi:hypothetical protein
MRLIGIELEFSDEKLFNRGMDKDRIHTDIRSIVRNELDDQNIIFRDKSSLSEWSFQKDHCGYEITTPAFKDNLHDLTLYTDISQAIHDQYGQKLFLFNNCGLHVHLSIKDLNLTNLYNMYKLFYLFEPVILKLFKAERQKSPYVTQLRSEFQPSSFTDPKRFLLKTIMKNFDKHELAVNVRLNNKEYERIEVRYWPGTFNGETIFYWIQLLLTLIEISISIEIESELLLTKPSFDDLYALINSQKLKIKWLSERKPNLIQWIEYRKNNRNKL